MEMEASSADDGGPPGADSRYGYTPAYELFNLIPRDLSSENTTVLYFSPISQLRHDAPIEFNIGANSQRYIDLKNIKLYLKVKLVKSDGGNISDDDKVTFSNYPICSLFQQVDLYLQQQLVCSSGTGYAYRGMLDVLLENDRDDMTGILRQGLYFRESSGSMDSTELIVSNNQSVNAGFVERKAFTKGSTTVELQGKLHADLCRQERVLLNAVQVTFKLTQSREPFRIMRPAPSEGDTAQEYKVQILNATLKVPMIKPTPAMLLGISSGLKISPALYPFERTEIKTVSIPSGQGSWAVDNLFLSRIPKRLVVAMVSESAYTGTYSKNPFNFTNFKLTYMCLTIDGSCVPSRAIQMDFDKDIYLDAYYTLFSIAQDEIAGKPRKTSTITREEYPKGHMCICFNIDGSSYGDEYINPQTFGLSKMELKFAENLKENVTLIMYAVYNSLLRIDEARNVKID